MSAIEITILLLTFLVSISIVWGSLRSGITPVPSSHKARQIILSVAEKASTGTIIELGSGWGNLALKLAIKFPKSQVIGYEISFIPWLMSLLLQRLQRVQNLTLRRKNFLPAKLPNATLAVCYLYPGGMEKLADKLQREQPNIEMLVSNTFALPGQEPEQIIRLDDIYKSPIYIYRLQKESSEIEK